MPNLLGDWKSKRNQMVEQGIIIETGVTAVVQTNTRGGINTYDTASSGGTDSIGNAVVLGLRVQMDF